MVLKRRRKKGRKISDGEIKLLINLSRRSCRNDGDGKWEEDEWSFEHGVEEGLGHYVYSGEKNHVLAGIGIFTVIFGIPWYLMNQGLIRF